MESKEITVLGTDKDKRLDIFIAEIENELSRSRIKSLIDEENILVNKIKTKAGYKIRENDIITINIPELKEISTKPQDIPLNIIYEDDDFIVINKQKGLVTHPAPGSEDNTLVNALLFHCKNLSGIGGELRPGIVHRIDKNTTGLLMVAKNDFAHQSLSKQIQEKTAKRFYKAIIIGNIKEDTGIINLPIDRNPKDRKKMAIVKDGREAITHWKVLERFNKFTLVELELETGRTHQIRVHLSHIKHGIIGDELYGPDIKIPVNLNGQALHAYKLKLKHPRKNEEMEFLAEEPSEFNNLLNYIKKTC
ncbi:MAG: RluA family pseudouridine synthase [Candidatus Sericytochromatia bacterium]